MEDKLDEHKLKVSHHANDHKAKLESKSARMERHSGTGHPIKEQAKKGGGGGGNWGSYKDDIEEAKAEL
ncbi:hypothetical protein OEZ86_011781 [Tetradesmus obliquus]|nr:hypothetical protein OEZ86_011781 [Tetradesmus obliquus]